MERETFGSRFGFLLISAGCAIGIGNVWRFPYITGQNGGGLFVLIYLFFLTVIGIPVLTMELAIGRASKKSCIRAYEKLEPKGSKWHFFGPLGMFGNYVIVMFYTIVCGWMLSYFFSFLTGGMNGLDTAGVEQHFSGLLASPVQLIVWMTITILIGIIVCSMGVQKGVERITKWMMIALLAIMVFLAVVSLTLDGGMEGLKFYLIPDIHKVEAVGLWKVIVAAMNQSFFTLSIGVGGMMIFGSYLEKDRRLVGESINIVLLDTFVAIVAGLIIFPSCFAFGISPDSGPGLIFITLPNVFNNMKIGFIWGSLFYLFMSFAALSTIIGVFENLLACCMDLWHWSRKKASMINLIVIFVASLPCALGFNLWSGFTPFGAGTNVLDLEDYVVNNILLPLGSLAIVFFCTTRYGWGFEKFLEEANTGVGLKMPKGLRWYLGLILPIGILVLLIRGIFRM